MTFIWEGTERRRDKTREIYAKTRMRVGVQGGGQMPKAKKVSKILEVVLDPWVEIKRDLLAQLESSNIKGKHYEDLIEDYMALWHIKNALIADIRTRGVTIPWQNSATQFGYKKNDSISELNKTNAQMLKILSELGLKAAPSERVDSDADEL